MRNSIILNGVKSDTVKGLLIQSLPPITKPMIRTQVEEIDGRDGDIVTKLGYSAYNKEMSIGLFGDFDIDAVIRYFDSEGKVIFSNEPDKYYNYQIVEQIDFERLLKFRTARVVFHVQPFKYSSMERLPVSNQYINFTYQRIIKNGVTLTLGASGKSNLIWLTGTATANTEFYIPVNIKLNEGKYTFSAGGNIHRVNNVFMRLIKDIPNNANSFGGRMLTLGDSETVNFTSDEDFNYLWIYVMAGNVTEDFAPELIEDDLTEIEVVNIGNVYSKPTITLTGVGDFVLYINHEEVMRGNLGTGENPLILNSSEMNAYMAGNLANRIISGDFKNMALRVGQNTVSWRNSDTIYKIEVEDYSRWI